MAKETPDYLSYLLRLWRAHERSPPDGRGPIWRASLQSPQTGERVSFATLDKLFTFLREQTGIGPDVEDPALWSGSQQESARMSLEDLYQTARESLTHVFWIGGPGCSGKSTIARLLASELGLRFYSVDAELHHLEPDPSLTLPKWRGISFSGKNGRPLMYLPSDEAAACVIDGWKAIFVRTLRHLLTLPPEPGMVVEGVFLPATLLRVADRERCAFVVSGRAFREQHFAHRREWYAAYEDKERAHRTAIEALDIMDRCWIDQGDAYNVPVNRITSVDDIHTLAAQLIGRLSPAAVPAKKGAD